MLTVSSDVFLNTVHPERSVPSPAVSGPVRDASRDTDK